MENLTSSTASNTSAPEKGDLENMHTVSPYLAVNGARQLIEFCKKAFAANELCCMNMPNGSVMHAGIRIGDSMIMMADACEHAKGPKELGGSPVTIHLQVDNAQELFDNAVAAGATVVMPIAEQFWGDLYGIVQDPTGHLWSIATHVRDVSPEEMMEAAKQFCDGAESK